MAPLYFEENGYSAALGEENYAARGRAATDSREDKLSTVKAQLGPHLIISLFSAQSLKCHCCFFRYQGEYTVKEIYLVEEKCKRMKLK